MLQPGQVLGDSASPSEAGRYQLVERLGRGPGRQTWRALAVGHLREVQGEQAIADPWDAEEVENANVDETSANQHQANDQTANDGETVILKFLAFSDEIDWGQVKLFEREASVLKGLDHPNLPRYRDSFSLEDRLLWFVLVQEDIPGQSLDQWLTGGGMRVNEPQLRQWAEALLEILIYLHGQSPPILHRDIKPSNVIWGDDQQIYLIDLGAAQDYVAQGTLGTSFTVVGSYGYAPLEQFGGRAVPASDLYALGATLVHLLTGIAPADLPQEDLRLQFEAEISAGFRRWLQTLLEPDLQRRVPSARAALMALRQLPLHQLPLHQLPLHQLPVSQQPAHPRPAHPQPAHQQPQGDVAELEKNEVGGWGEGNPVNVAASVDSADLVESATILQPEPSDGAEPRSPQVAPSVLSSSEISAPARQPTVSASMALAPKSDALAPAGARLRLKRSPDLLLVELPGEELGYVFGVLGVGFSILALLAGSAALIFCLLFTLVGVVLATPRMLRFERRGADIRFSSGKQLGGYLLRWSRHRPRGALQNLFHTVESSPKAIRNSAQQFSRGGGGFSNSQEPWQEPQKPASRQNCQDLGRVDSNRRTLVVQTQSEEIAISTSLSWQESGWLIDQIYAWWDRV